MMVEMDVRSGGGFAVGSGMPGPSEQALRRLGPLTALIRLAPFRGVGISAVAVIPRHHRLVFDCSSLRRIPNVGLPRLESTTSTDEASSVGSPLSRDRCDASDEWATHGLEKRVLSGTHGLYPGRRLLVVGANPKGWLGSAAGGRPRQAGSPPTSYTSGLSANANIAADGASTTRRPQIFWSVHTSFDSPFCDAAHLPRWKA